MLAIKRQAPSQNLLKELMSFKFSNSDDEYTFEQRLAVENGWTECTVEAVVLEYKRFLFMMAISDYPLTPSWEVDQVWHLHLLYTDSYWNDLCHKVLKFPLHHHPTKGGDNEHFKFYDWYTKTLKLYEKTFEETPPASIWPSPAYRFGIEDENIKREQAYCMTDRGIWIGRILIAIIIWVTTSWVIGIIWYVTSGFFHTLIVGEKCEKCCRFHALKRTGEDLQTQGIIWTCKYCGSMEQKDMEESTCSDAGGCGGCGG